ncbi:dihydropteroate synthase [Clostridium grantii]|uniref:Dihydropteroate synthase n=1 Tax=Clostridium grantii DSM 8605 TaxID=1121316 RepID=A0A1M5QIG1_9CLOT|nr:dihydropteroate synthase [Clostridium grantii]SHH13882.1 dihydropteroate synthase [Clostridium grantii DSM 8605]
MREYISRDNKGKNLKCGDFTLKLGEKTHIMGILNVTPDSFSDGGKYEALEDILKQGKQMIEEGASIIDIGGESTRPGAEEVTIEEELNRVVPAVKKLLKEVAVPISVDTYKWQVAEKVLELGAHIINDIWGLQKDERMAKVVAKYKVPVVIMHNKNGNEYRNDIMEEIKEFFRVSIDIALSAGIEKDKIILDPGIGFGKTPEQNILVMSRLNELNELGFPVLLGTSRKSMIGKILDLEASERVEGTVSTSVIGVMLGADIIRVHDVKENYRAVKVADTIVRGAKPWIEY